MLKQEKTVFIIFLFLFNVSSLVPQENTYFIEGKIHFKGKGNIYIILVNENTFSYQTEGISKMIYSPSILEEQSGEILFIFKNIKPGIYGIKCFLDQNSNGKLDKKLFIPAEPWGMSWKDKKPFGPPKFNDIEFEVTSNVKNIVIEVN
jgi:uncharacterized protein (DUF2141 family)